MIYGFPTVEVKRTSEHSTYGFCPKCRKSYNAGLPVQIKAMKKEPKLYRSAVNKIIFGVCGGIAEYTELPVKLIRCIFVIAGLIFPAFITFTMISNETPLKNALPGIIPPLIPGAIYLLVSILDIMPQKPNH